MIYQNLPRWLNDKPRPKANATSILSSIDLLADKATDPELKQQYVVFSESFEAAIGDLKFAKEKYLKVELLPCTSFSN